MRSKNRVFRLTGLQGQGLREAARIALAAAVLVGWFTLAAGSVVAEREFEARLGLVQTVRR